LAFGYNQEQIIVSVIAPSVSNTADAIVKYVYDNSARLQSAIYADTHFRRYHYEDARFPNALTGITDENGVRYATWSYDAQGRAISSEHAGGVDRHELTYNAGNTVVKDPLGTQRIKNLTTILGVVKSTGDSQPGGSGCGPASSALTYDANGNVATRTDFKGNQTTYTYDLSRNLETKRVEASGKPESRTISTQWHSYWRQPVKLAEPKKLTTWVFNGDGGAYCAPPAATVPSINGGTQPIGVVCSRTEQATTDASGSTGFAATVTGTPRTWRYTYDTYGQVLTADGPRTDVADVTTTTYYAANDPDMGKRGNLATITNALGQVTHITAYDLNGNPLTIVDPNGMQTTLTYDLRQRLTSRTVGGETTTYTYDGVGQLLKVTLPDGSHTTYTYDPAHRLTGIADALGNRITYTLDAIGNRTKEDVKDPAGQLARTRSRIYDALSRLAQDIGAQGQATRYEYDANGNRTKTTDPLNQVTVSNYDALNRLIRVTDPGLGQTRYGWDGQDRLTQVTDPRNLVTTYTLDGLGNQQSLHSPDTGTTGSTFDAAGNEVTRTDAKGQTTTTRYDALNRPTRITYADGSATHYLWDRGANGIGRLGTIEEYDSNGNRLRSIVLNHDPQGRLTGEIRTLGNVSHRIAYGYHNGQLSRLTLPSAKQLTYTRNAAGQITQVALTANGQSKTLLQNIAYHPFGGVKHFTDGAGQLHSRSHDQDGRTSSYTLGGQTWLLSYDAASRITGLIDGGQAANSATYGYDALDRLTGASLPATAYAYAYDANGNRTAHTAGSTTRAYTTAATSNRLQSLTNPARSLSHDANGSRTTDGSQQYAYDVRGRLSQSITAAGTTHYQVNALGQRVGKRNGTTETLYHYDQAGRLLAESDAAGNLQREYVWLDDIPVAVLQ
jgi:YD repeat-containing protein